MIENGRIIDVVLMNAKKRFVSQASRIKMFSKFKIFIIITFLFWGSCTEVRNRAQVLPPADSVSGFNTPELVSDQRDGLQAVVMDYCQAANESDLSTIKELIVDDIQEVKVDAKAENVGEAPDPSGLDELRRRVITETIPETIHTGDMKVEEIETLEGNQVTGKVRIVLRSSKVPSLQRVLFFKLRMNKKSWRIYDVTYLDDASTGK
jgi:hypothetical protein